MLALQPYAVDSTSSLPYSNQAPETHYHLYSLPRSRFPLQVPFRLSLLGVPFRTIPHLVFFTLLFPLKTSFCSLTPKVKFLASTSARFSQFFLPLVLSKIHSPYSRASENYFDLFPSPLSTCVFLHPPPETHPPPLTHFFYLSSLFRLPFFSYLLLSSFRRLGDLFLPAFLYPTFPARLAYSLVQHVLKLPLSLFFTLQHSGGWQAGHLYVSNNHPGPGFS